MESAMNPAWLYATSTFMAGYSSSSWPSTVCTERATVTVLAPASLYTRIPTASLPS
jgi:hypothetical protein